MHFKPNKIALRIAHFFGCRKGEEHIDDVTMNINIDSLSEKEIEDVQCKTEPAKYLVDFVKEQVYTKLQSDKKFEARCRKTTQVWVTFYHSDELSDKHRSSLLKMFYYSKEGKLYYSNKSDVELYKKEVEPFLEKNEEE